MSLKPQTPGDIVGTDTTKIDDLLQNSVTEVVQELDNLTTDEVMQALAQERAGANRKTLIVALERELDGREFPGDEQPAAPKSHIHPYAHLRAKDVDRSTLTTMVLTLDGWLLPLENNVETVKPE